MRAPVNSDSAFNYIRRREIYQGSTNALTPYPANIGGNPTICATALGHGIGFGMGFELIAWAEQRPEWRLLGVGFISPALDRCCLV